MMKKRINKWLRISVLTCLAAGVIGLGRPAAAAAGNLNQKTEGSRRIVEGDFFRITWDGRQGGQISEILLHDGIAWRSILPKGAALPALEIVSGGKKYTLAGDTGASFRAGTADQSGEEIQFTFAGELKGPDGTAPGVSARQAFTLHRNGVLFCDLELKFNRALAVEAASLGLRLDKSAQPTLRREKVTRHGLILWSGDAPKWEPVKAVRYPDPYVLFSLADEAGGRPWTNHVDFWVEGRDALGGTGYIQRKPLEAGEFGHTWNLAAAGGIQAAAGTVYRNRWGLGLGRAVTGGRLIGARVYHWLGRHGDKPFLPTDEALKRMADDGANILILHDDWVADHRPMHTYRPYNEEEAKDLDRLIASAHKLGLRLMVYLRPYPHLLADNGPWKSRFQRDWDGIYIDHASTEEFSEYAMVFGTPALDYAFAAKQYLRYTQELRRTVGDGGFLIMHTGAAEHGFGHAVVDAYLSGESRTRMLESPRVCVEGMMPSAAVPTIWTWRPEQRPYLTPRAVAYWAGLGAFPHVTFHHENALFPEAGGYKPMPKENQPAPISDSRGRSYIWPLWQIWRTLPFPYTGEYYTRNNHAPVTVIRPADRTVETTVYQPDGESLLVIVSNLAEETVPGVTLDLEKSLKIPAGSRLVEMTASGFDLKCRVAAQTFSGRRIAVGELGPYQYKGYLLTKKALPAHLQALLEP